MKMDALIKLRTLSKQLDNPIFVKQFTKDFEAFLKGRETNDKKN